MLATVMVMAAAAVAAPAGSVQAGFDAADALADKGDWAGALAAYEALMPRVTNTRTRAVLMLRRGEVLTSLGRGEEGRRLLRAGLAALPATETALAGVKAASQLILAQSEELAFDLPQALADYNAARSFAVDRPDRLRALSGAIRTGMFVDPAAAVADADAALALVDAAPNPDKALRAGYLTLKGRALLNAGRATEASRVLAQATAGLGGLTAKLDNSDYVARSDMAIAALRAGRDDEARRYLAFTGAGGAKVGAIKPGAEMNPPACGDPADPAEPHADDVAVVQFGITDFGQVVGVQPVFASRPGPMIRAFLEATAGWSWTAERAGAIRPFFRQSIRLEMRCSVTAERPGDAWFGGDMETWLAARGIAPAPRTPSAATTAIALRDELARRIAADGPAALSLVPVLIGIVESPVTTRDETAEAAPRIAAIVAAARPPAPVPVSVVARTYSLRGPQGATTAERERLRRASVAGLAAIEAEPAVRADARASAMLALMLAGPDTDARAAAVARSRLTQVADDARLGARDPLKVGANLRLASLAAAAGDLAAARAAYERTGLTAMQCALVDAKPAMTKTGLNNSIYPMEALRWGFEGWARTEFDVAADGRTRNIRTIVAYPPFVFGDATATGVARTRYTQSYRPEGGLGCGGETVNVNYVLPQ